MALVIKGRIAPLDRDDPDAVFAGRVFIDDSGSIERVTRGNAAAPSGFSTTKEVDVGTNLVLPGFIDLHNHVGYNTLPLWAEPKQKTPFAHHDSWPRAESYRGSISLPAKAVVQAAPEALLAYVQLRALVGGTSAIQGWPAANRRHAQVLRNVDDETAGSTNHDLILTSTLTKTPLDLAKVAQAQKGGAGFIYHCAEGQVGTIVEREFTDARSAGCLTNTFIGVHLSAVTKADWKTWKSTRAGAIAWSPFSNYWLYGITTDVSAAIAQEIAVCLGSDWGPSGTKNVQGEMKVALLANQKEGFGLTERDIVSMVTSNPGIALSRCWRKSIGQLVPDAFGDVLVLHADGVADNKLWKHIVASTEKDVMLVVYDGRARYGDDDVMVKAGVGDASRIKVAGKDKRFAIPNPKKPDEWWSWKAITDALDAVRKNPASALENANAMRSAWAGSMDEDDAPLELVLDMPSGELPMAGDLKKHAKDIVIPPLPSLQHDDAFFESITGRGFHGTTLDGLAPFYA
jgi:5-methylthioadenosine/S-adenosylhomocysteine deaminase